MNQTAQIVLLCTDGDSTRAVARVLRENFGAENVAIIQEEPISRVEMAKRRAKKLGIVQTSGQVLFSLVVAPVLSRASKKRIGEIERQYDLKPTEELSGAVRIDSVNSDAGRAALVGANPRVVVLNGTRIVGKKTLRAVDAPFINMHAGITPLYRGVHGAYWALAENKPELVGTTVHLVDEGIDTGNIIEQAFFETTENDNFATYPYLHTAAGLAALVRAVRRALDGDLETNGGIHGLESKLRYHPTIWEYLRRRWRDGVR